MDALIRQRKWGLEFHLQLNVVRVLQLTRIHSRGPQCTAHRVFQDDDISSFKKLLRLCSKGRRPLLAKGTTVPPTVVELSLV